ncbi:DNA-3-methyladenine glycosylase I [Varunaivibrio sulfuroxidans]|uniref:DNA-3-methyladenine glycosylase I n=1 Tax=Varunaivibrio sulfuroxidans TaxID=1773489 RepID=A0A4R3JCK6_9PROT|nr:DNA-3-methyladenine glycosylase I [Varunaivibrio sulfuroxidans]TCS63492.1 DNA-3-methyladenine glycosylase I [Varunaivibrio sulfuroxidans]WES30363.1 DNA-3-methyladenine glycosylase I [Varunaivibrio sulfuroxidans]
MRPFRDIFEDAANRKGGENELERLLLAPRPPEEIEATPAERWLSEMTKAIFQVGFNWQLVENKWPRFEEVFEGFDVNRWSMMSEEDLDTLLATPGLIANAAKMKSVGENARYLLTLEGEHGSVGAFFAGWRNAEYCDNLRALRKGASRMGGKTGQIMLRRMGVDTMVFSTDVLKALAREGVVAKAPNSAKDFSALQTALDTWRRESARPLIQISQTLAFSIA